MMTRFLPILALLLAGCGDAVRTHIDTTPVTPDLDLPVGHFSLTERSGRTVSEQDLRDSVWVASFVFTRCMGPCPAVTATVAHLQEELKDSPGIKFVTFTVDPNHDDRTKLCEYADKFHANPERWLFLTGDEATIHKLMREQFKQAVERKTGEDVKPGDEFGHSTRLLLVDKKGTIRATYDGMANLDYPEGQEQFNSGLIRLKERAKELVQEE